MVGIGMAQDGAIMNVLARGTIHTDFEALDRHTPLDRLGRPSLPVC